MKYKTFRALVLGVAGIGVAIGLWQCGQNMSCGSKGDTPAPTGFANVKTVMGSDHPEYLRHLLGTPANTEKLKDALGPKGPKVNVYAEAGIWKRAKVDLDRDEKWDEKWTFTDGRIEQQIAPDDDENYTQTQQFTAGEAAVPTVDTAAPEPTPAVEPATAMRPVDAAMDEALGRPVVDKIKDASKGHPFKINLYSDSGNRWDRAKVDLDRDEKWDEKWTFEADGSTERQVAPADDDVYTELWIREGSGWRQVK